MKKLLTAALTITAAAFMTSCELRPLVDPNNKVRIEVTIDTDNVSNVTSDIYNPRLERPVITTDMVRCMFYDPASGRLLNQNFISEKSFNDKGQEVISGVVDAVPDTYNLICYNFDTPNTFVRDEDEYEKITAYTAKVPNALISKVIPTKDFSWSNLKVTYDPDHLVVSRDLDLTIKPHTDAYTIRTTARTCIDTYYLQVRVRGAKNLNNISAIINGLSPENQFSRDIRRTDESTGVFFDMKKDYDERIQDENQDVICGLFSTFGKIEDISSDAFIVMTLNSKDGKTYQKTINLDKVFKTEDAIKRHWLLVDEIIDIPEPDPDKPQSGFEPKVEEWEEEHGTIIL